MKFKYLGTAAAEGCPAIFCACDYCVAAREAGGKNIRTRSQSLINDDLLIDFPLDSYHHALVGKLNLSSVRNVLITHSHLDHFVPCDLYMRERGYAHNLINPIMTFYSNQAVIDKFHGYCSMYGGEEAPPPSVEFKRIIAYTPTVVGNYTVTALHAKHAFDEEALLYYITDSKKSILYLHDTGFLYDEVYDYLKANKLHADFVSYDCTFFYGKDGYGHLGLDDCVEVRKKLCECGVVTDSTVNCVNHFSHNKALLHTEMEALAESKGFLCSFDGMEITI